MKPMLASAVKNPLTLQFPLIVSPKLDGIRCLMVDGKPFSRTMKPIPNRYIQQYLTYLPLDKVDGELMVPGKFNNVQSGIMSHKGEPDFVYNLFDCFENEQAPFEERYSQLVSIVNSLHCATIQLVDHSVVKNINELYALEERFVSQGYEGLMIRHPEGPYKQGRSTLKQGYLLKLKRFFDAEAKVIGFNERMTNTNEAFKDELGHTKRSTKKEGMIATNTLGSFQVEALNGVTFEVGTGLTEEQRVDMWNRRDELIGQFIKFKYQEIADDTGRPRFPVFLGFRHPEDM